MTNGTNRNLMVPVHSLEHFGIDKYPHLNIYGSL
jgi:hypothetical protein